MLFESDTLDTVELVIEYHGVSGYLESLDYQAETDKTASGTFTPGNVGAVEFTEVLAQMIHAGKRMDVFKKALFRKRSREECGLLPLENEPTLAHFLGEGCETYDNLFHGIVGMITEVGELAEVLYDQIAMNQKPDLINVREEIGDNLWYISRLIKWADTTWLTVMRQNISKLRKRHGEAFDKHRDINRDLAAERSLLEGDSD